MSAPPATQSTPLPIPDLPAYDSAAEITLREACNRGLVHGEKGKRLSGYVLQRWCTKGCRIVAGGPLYRFPSLKSGRERLTTPAWCAAWNGFVARVRAAEARRQLEAWEKARGRKGDRPAGAW